MNSPQLPDQFRELLADRDGDGLPDGLQVLGQLQALQGKQAQLRELRRLHGAALATRVTSIGVVGRAIGIALVCGILWAVVTVGPMGSDPWLGAHSAYFCPKICTNCEGPYVWSFSSTSHGNGRRSSDSIAYCRAPGVGIEMQSSWSKLINRNANAPYELPNAVLNLGLSSMALWLALGLPLGALVMARSVSRAHAAAPGLEQRIRQLENELARAGRPMPGT